MSIKSTAFALVLIVVLAVTMLARTQAQDSAMPPGVSEENWIPISDSVGIVVTSLRTGPDGQALGSGRVMARLHGVWIVFEELEASPLPRVHPLK